MIINVLKGNPLIFSRQIQTWYYPAYATHRIKKTSSS